ncbi:potassium channel family protein [Methanospirillum stamsii]|uniref:Potassium transporter TrkA n=1 Tax=Methanospirillum stamsii TaxID=1277351 RepID=A0A2V2MND7_9EURY|nr:NAD-binding protein [Methanospirillum stamsii]PWR69754.1 potassium transporter TrkA [Methanospirillum stamsii]
MSLSVLIAGGGKVGTYLAKILLSGGHQVTILEGDKEDYGRLQHEFPDSLLKFGDPTSPFQLQDAGIKSVNVVAAVTRSDEINLVIASLAKFEFRVKRTIARVNIPKNSWLFTREMGVDVTVNQADIMAHLIAREMSVGDMMTMLKLRTGEYSLVENIVADSSEVVGRAIKDIPFPQECVISAILRNGKIVIPRGNVILSPGDEVLAVMNESSIEKMQKLLRG